MDAAIVALAPRCCRRPCHTPDSLQSSTSCPIAAALAPPGPLPSSSSRPSAAELKLPPLSHLPCARSAAELEPPPAATLAPPDLLPSSSRRRISTVELEPPLRHRARACPEPDLPLSSSRSTAPSSCRPCVAVLAPPPRRRACPAVELEPPLATALARWIRRRRARPRWSCRPAGARPRRRCGHPGGAPVAAAPSARAVAPVTGSVAAHRGGAGDGEPGEVQRRRIGEVQQRWTGELRSAAAGQVVELEGRRIDGFGSEEGADPRTLGADRRGSGFGGRWSPPPPPARCGKLHNVFCCIHCTYKSINI